MSSITGYPNGISSFGVPVFGNLAIGNVYIVADTTSVAYQEYAKRYGNTVYDDGTQMFHPHTATSTVVTTNGFKAAAASCMTDRNDYIIVMPSSNTYYIDEVLTLSKKSVHLLCPSAMTCETGCMSSARLQQIGSASSIISIENGGIEVAGFYLKNITGYAHIQVPTTATCVADGGASAWGINIHHNYFVSRSSSTTLPMIYCTGDGASYSRIERNWFTEQVSNGAWTIGIVHAEAAGANTDIFHNVFTIGDTGNATYGIYSVGVKSVVAHNIFSECGTSTIASCVTIGATGSAIGNRAAVASGHFSDASGTTAVSYCDNADGVTNATGTYIQTGQLQT